MLMPPGGGATEQNQTTTTHQINHLLKGLLPVPVMLKALAANRHIKITISKRQLMRQANQVNAWTLTQITPNILC
jgi:hypothetical protein